MFNVRIALITATIAVATLATAGQLNRQPTADTREEDIAEAIAAKNEKWDLKEKKKMISKRQKEELKKFKAEQRIKKIQAEAELIKNL